jgi:hypothetical protein
MIHLFPRLICGFCLALVAAAQEPTAPPAPAAPARPGFRISGIAVDAASGVPLSKARVSIAPAASTGSNAPAAPSFPNARNANRIVPRAVTTGEDGRFVFENVSVGKYSLSAQTRGYPPQGFDQHENFSTAIAVGPDLDSENLVFRLRREASISGKVTDDQFEPVRNAQVMLFNTGVVNGQQRTMQGRGSNTDDEGSYHFGHLPPGKYFVAVSAQPWYANFVPRGRSRGFGGGGPDATLAVQTDESNPLLDMAYPLTFYGGATESTAATPIVLQSGDRMAADVTLHAVPAVHLRVRTGNSEPRFAVNLTRRIFDGSETGTPNQMQQSTPGVMDIVGLAPGRYVIHFRANDGKSRSNTEREIDVAGDAEIDAGDAAATAAAINGALKFDTPPNTQPGAPSAQPLIQLRNIRSREMQSAQAQANGTFELQSVPIGTYEIAVMNVPGFVLRSIAASGARVMGQRLQISSPQSVQLTVEMSRGLDRVDGIALRDGKPMAGVMIVLVPADPANNASLFRRDQSDSDGTFSLPSILPGKYTVVAIMNGWEIEWANPGVLRDYLPQGEIVQAEANGKYNIRVTVQ